ncbi:MAG TPA: DedA family protein [Candidatus Sulfotelmatobacter sp.]|nr:DedA family protein [Candidatus Sulfotelmatobacter sp.]
MAQHIFELLRGALVHYGYWAIAVALLLENTGVPVPGETVLLLASFLAYSEHDLRLPWIIVVGTIAAALGDNLGYEIGHRGGRPMLERYRAFWRISPATLAKGDHLFERYGAVAVFFARFVFGLRIVAGPLAGVLRMPWKKFVLFNFLGAFLWVTAIACVGYSFGRHWERLVQDLKRFDITVAVMVLLTALYLWRRSRKEA